MVRMTNSILLTVKKMLGIAEEYKAFDIDIIVDINATFLTLNQLGVGPSTPFQITGDDEIWSDFINPEEMPGIQTYIYMRTRLMFDPPTNSFLVDSMKKQCEEFEWRMMMQAEWNKNASVSPPEEPEPPVDDSEGEAIRRLLGEDAYKKRIIRRKEHGVLRQSK